MRPRDADAPHALKPDVHIYVRSKVPWMTLPHGAPAFEAYYDPEKLWPAESLEAAARDFALDQKRVSPPAGKLATNYALS